MTLDSRFLALALPPMLVFCQSTRDNSPHFVAGPEATDLIAHVHGTILVDEPKGGIVAIALPSLRQRNLRDPDTGHLPAYSLAGPDANGRVAFVENDGLRERHALKLGRASTAVRRQRCSSARAMLSGSTPRARLSLSTVAVNASP